MGKSVILTYILWLFGGQLGLHHLYLGRDRHAFTWFVTLGGVFGLGWLREIARLPQYVREANQSKEFVEKRANLMRQKSKPPYNSTRFAGELIMGTLFGYLLSLALPSDDEFAVAKRWIQLLVPFAVAVGVHLVGNIGMERGNLLWPTVGAYIASIITAFNPKSIAWSAVFSAFFFNWKSRNWLRQPRKRRNIFVRFIRLSLAGSLFFLLLGSFLYFNASYQAPDGTVITFRQAVHSYFESQQWKDMKKSFDQLREHVEYHGWQHVLGELISALDPFGESRAYHVLEISPKATLAEVTSRYRKLSREWHPDRHRDPEKKAIAQKRFIEITQAYEKIRDSRTAKPEDSGTGRHREDL